MSSPTATQAPAPARRSPGARRAARVLGVPLLVAAAIGASCATASAASGDAGLVYAGSNVRSAPYTYAGLIYTARYNAYIPLQCYTDTTESGATRRWFKFNQANEWTVSTNVGNQPSLPHC